MSRSRFRPITARTPCTSRLVAVVHFPRCLRFFCTSFVEWTEQSSGNKAEDVGNGAIDFGCLLGLLETFWKYAAIPVATVIHGGF